MDVNAVAIVIFFVFAILTPASLIFASIMLRRRTKRNPVRDAAYESAEASTGTRISVMNEYLHYFGMFIAYEILVAMILVWAPVARTISFNSSVAMITLLIIGMAFAVFVMLIARKDDRYG